jgi:hypothetical protein
VPQARLVVEGPDLGGDHYFEIEILDLTGREEVRIVLEEALDRSDAAFALLDAIPEVADGVADRCYGAHSRHHDAAAGTRISHIGFAFLS